MKADTKQRILDNGAEIIHLKGFHNTGIQEILKAAGVPKGSFYNYFKNKEDFGLQLIDYFMGHFALMTKDVIEDNTLSPLEKISQIFDRFADFFHSKGYAYGCPIGNLSQEMGDLSPAFREKLKFAVDSMVDAYAGLMAAAQGARQIPALLDVKEAAYFLVSSWHGALMRMKIEKGPKPLENHRRFIFEYILRS